MAEIAGTNTSTDNGAGAQNNGAASGAAANAASNGTGAQNNDNLSAFDKFLQGEGMQAEFDRRVNKALKTQEGKLTANIQQRIDDAVTEAQKLAKMTKDQQDDYKRQQQIDDLTKREAEITRRELTATAKETLQSKGLPAELASILNYTNAEETNASIEAVEKAFQSAVQARVEEKLKGGKTPTKAQGGGVASIEEMIRKSMKAGFFS